MKTIFEWHDTLSGCYVNQSAIDLKKSLKYEEYCEAIRFGDHLKRDTCYFWNSFDFTLDLFVKAKELMVRKNHDYAGDHDPFSNFRLCEQSGLCSVMIGMLVRLGDKVSRLDNLKTKTAKVNESIEDTKIDVINYCVLLLAYLNEE